MTAPDPAPPKSTRFLPSTVYGWVGVVLVFGLFAFLTYPLITRDPESGMRYSKELSQLKMISVAIVAYAADHDGFLPERVSMLQDSEHEYIPSETDMDWFRSPFHENGEMAEELADEEAPTDWYMYGHYHFYPMSGLHEDDISDAADFVLAYGSIQGDPPKRAAVFFDGSVRWVSVKELRDLIARQRDPVDRE